MCCLYLHRKHHSLFLSAYLSECIGHFEFKALFSLSSAFCKSRNFSVPGHPTGLTCGVGTSKSLFWDQEFLLSANFLFQAIAQAAGFLQVLPRSLFKRLVLSTTLWQLAKMITTLRSPKGLKYLERKKGQLSSWQFVPYAPLMDLVNTKEVQETLKIKLPDGTIFNMSIFSQGNTKEYIAHVVAVLPLINQNGQV
jgi:hypothetical protein